MAAHAAGGSMRHQSVSIASPATAQVAPKVSASSLSSSPSRHAFNCSTVAAQPTGSTSIIEQLACASTLCSVASAAGGSVSVQACVASPHAIALSVVWIPCARQTAWMMWEDWYSSRM
jgi:hypothetical protein